MAKNIDLSDLMTRHQAEQGITTKAIVPEKVEREVEAAVDALSPEELEKVEQIKDSIDMTDSEALLTYGAPAQKKIAAFSDSVLAQVRTKDNPEDGRIKDDPNRHGQGAYEGSGKQGKRGEEDAQEGETEEFAVDPSRGHHLDISL